MKKNLIAITGGLILASVFLWLTPKALAYSPATTHPDLTREIISFYELSTGKKITDEQKQWVIQGSMDEDKAPRWINHFYDPIFERGFQAESVGISGYLAKNWAQFSSYQTINPGNIANLWTGNGPVISGSWWGDFSYEVAIKDYSKSKEKEAYLALGHILHLIEDITVPEHTRNDPHPGGDMPSYYENWTKDNSSGLTQDLGKRVFNQGNKAIIYADLESYFNNLATYTNTHFFSPRTINSKIYQKPKIVYEDETFAYGKDENGELFDLTVVTTDRKSNNKNYYLDNSQILQEYWLRLSRQAVLNGAGVIQLFLTEAEKAKEVELAKQKVDAQQMAQKSSFFGSIVNFFRNPGDNNQPALTITSKPTKAAPKINQIQPKLVTPQTQIVNPVPISVPASTKTPAPVVQNTPNQTNSQTVQPPQNTAPVVYGGGGGGGGISTTINTSTNTNNATSSNSITTSDSTDQNSNTQTFQAGDLVINEIMYNPEGTDDKHEWIELYNNSGHEITLTGGSDGWKFSDGSTSLHGLNEPPINGSQGSMTIAPGGYMILADNAVTFLVDHSGFGGTVIDTVMDLKNSTSTIKTIKIITPNGTIIDEVLYSNSWGANGNGKTLERKLAGGASNEANNWAESSAKGGTPGAANNWSLTSNVNVVASTTVAFDNNATSTPETATSTELLIALGTDVPATTTISTNTNWTLAGSPYRLFFDSQRRPTVAAGSILTILPGVKIVPQGGNYTALEIQGTLNAVATSGAPIIFTSINDSDNNASTTPQKGEWLNIAFSQGAQANLDYVEFRYGGQGLERPIKEMVKVVGATININHSKFENSQSIALRLVDSEAVIENSIFSDNACGISVDSLVLPSSGTDGGCASNVHSFYSQAVATTTPQIKNNQFSDNRLIAVEVRDGSTPILDNNIFTDNGYPIRIENSYPDIANSQIANFTTSPNILNGIAISGRTHFSKNYTLKKDLPYILETDGPALSPYVDSGATLTIEPGVIFKIGHTFTALNINGAFIASTTPDNPIVFTSLKDDSMGGDTNNDGLASTPQNNDWANIKFFIGSIGNFANTIFNYGGNGSPPAVTTTSSQLIANFPSSSDVLNQSCDAMTSNISPNNSGIFSKVVIHKLTNHNSITTAFFQINVIGGGIVDQILVQNPSYNNSEVELNFTSSFNSGSQYNVRFMGVTDGSIATGCDFGTDATGNLVSAWYKSVTTVSNPALSIDSGATVVIQ